MTTLRLVHSSSRFNRSPESLHSAVNTYIDKNDADIVLLTEVSRESREKAMRHVGFTSSTGDKSGWDDCGVMVSNYRYDIIYEESFNMGGTGRYARIVVVEDTLRDLNFVVAVPHFPASVESELAEGRETFDSRLWYKAVRGLRKRANRLRRRFKAAFAIISADWNINFQRTWARALLKSLFPFWKNTWQKFTASTHGRRLIDALLIKGRVKIKAAARRLPDDDSSDHKPFIVVLEY